MTDERGRLFAKFVQMLDWAYDKTRSGYFGWASVLYIQLRMVSAIALIRGYSLQSDQVRSLAYASLCGTRAADILKDVGIRFAVSAIHHIGRETITNKVGSRLFTTMGRTGVVNVGKMTPLIGGLVGGGIDASTTKIIGIIAKRLFVQRDHRGAEWDRYQAPAIGVIPTTT